MVPRGVFPEGTKAVSSPTDEATSVTWVKTNEEDTVPTINNTGDVPSSAALLL